METPALLLHLDVVERNLGTMAGRARGLGLGLRPHIKTHACVELGRRQIAHGARGITVSTLDEAEVFADAGFDDILWAFPLDPTHIPHARRVAERTRLGVVVDDLDTARALRQSGLTGWLKVDCGYHRAGVDPASPYAVEVARALAGAGTFGGIVSHSGHAYKTRGRLEAAVVAEEERRVMTTFADQLRGRGMEVPAVSVGSTPAMMALERGDGLTEGRPGNYVFFDRTMVEIGVCEPRDVGVTVLATVVSHQPGSTQFIVDAGALALSKDVGPTHLGLTPAMGVIKDHPALTLVSLSSQEHGIVRAKAAGEIDGRFKVGEPVEIVPNHSCLTVAHFDHYHVMEGGKETASWSIARDRNTLDG